MRKGYSKLSLVAVMVLSALGLVALAGCGGGGATTTTTNAAATTSVTGATTTTAEAQRLVVGGKEQAEYEAALPELQKKLEAAPDDLDLLQELAVAQYNLKKYDEAAETYQKMLSIEDKAMVRNNYANVLRDKGERDQAKQEYAKAIELDPTLAVAYVNLASIMVTEKNMDEALKVLDQGIAATGEADKERLQAYKDRLTAAKE